MTPSVTENPSSLAKDGSVNKLFIATPRSKAYLDGYVRSLFQTSFDGVMVWKALPNLAVDISRNYLVQEAQKEEATAILWADVDATWAQDSVMRLWERDKDIITAAIYKRSIPPVPTWGISLGYNEQGKYIYSFKEGLQAIIDHARAHKLDHKGRADILLPKRDDDLMELDGCGSHFMMVKMEVYDKIIPPYYKTTSQEAGEDFYFCRKAKEAGYKIWGDKSVQTGHEFGTGAELGIRTLLDYCRFTDDVILSEDNLMEVGKWH